MGVFGGPSLAGYVLVLSSFFHGSMSSILSTVGTVHYQQSYGRKTRPPIQMERTNMKTQWACLLLLASALSLLPATCGADPVDLGVGGNLSGEYSLGPNQSISENFTLDY